MELKEALRIALHKEEKASSIYSEAAKNSECPLMKRTFEYLVAQENKHAESVKRLIESKNLSLAEMGDSPKEVIEFFSNTSGDFKEKTTLCESDVAAYKAGLELERSSFNFYKELAEKTDDDEVKKLLNFLKEQENAHFNLLQKSHDFLEDPEHFHASEEDWLFEG